MDVNIPKPDGYFDVRLDQIDVDTTIPSLRDDDPDNQDRVLQQRMSIRYATDEIGRILLPITVCRSENGRFKIVDGLARLREAQYRGWETLNALVFPPLNLSQMIVTRAWCNDHPRKPTPEEVHAKENQKFLRVFNELFHQQQ